jgi:hypothetical protein
MPKISSPVVARYNARLQKGGALLEDMRLLVRSWEDGPIEPQREKGIVTNVLGKATRARAADVYKRIFLPRFVNGPLPSAWKFARALEDQSAPLSLLRPVYYWITAEAEPMIADFCGDYLVPRMTLARAGVGVPETVNWLQFKGCDWSPAVITKVAHGLLAALKDFGILEGRVHKRLASVRLPVGAMAYIAYCLFHTGVIGRQLVAHDDWKIFILTTGEVESLFLEAHQWQLLRYYAAGSIVSIEFPTQSLEDYARVVVERSHRTA